MSPTGGWNSTTARPSADFTGIIPAKCLLRCDFGFIIEGFGLGSHLNQGRSARSRFLPPSISSTHNTLAMSAPPSRILTPNITEGRVWAVKLIRRHSDEAFVTEASAHPHAHHRGDQDRVPVVVGE